MNPTDEDRQEYERAWSAVLRNVLEYTDADVIAWMQRYGEHLLSDDSVVFHEEPWYWVCMTIVNHFSSDSNPQRVNELEKEVFWILDKAMRETPMDAIKWEIVRDSCRALS